MEQDTQYERPNTVSGLLAKRDELTKLHRKLSNEAKQTRSDIDSLNAVIRLFDPSVKGQRINPKRYAPQHAAKRGELKRFIMEEFRNAEAPLSTRDMTGLWIKHQGAEVDTVSLARFKSRVYSAIALLRDQGVVVSAKQDDGRVTVWELSRDEE